MKVSPGLIPGKLILGTPSILAGTIKPCQCNDVSTLRLFVTLSVTVSPSLNLKRGPGTVPLIAVNFPFLPSIFCERGPISRLKVLGAGDMEASWDLVMDLAQTGKGRADPRPVTNKAFPSDLIACRLDMMMGLDIALLYYLI